MKIKIRAMYFSGTGTTAKVTSAVAYSMWQYLDGTENKVGVSGATDDKIDYIKESNIDFTPKASRSVEYSFDENDIIVFGTPVIAGRVPNVLLEFLHTIKGGGATAVPIVLYGNRNFDDALIELRNILQEQGFNTVAAGAFIGEHSFSRILAAGRPDIYDMKKAEELAVKAAGKINTAVREADGDMKKVSDFFREEGPVDVNGETPLRPYYQPRDRNGNPVNILKVKPLLVTDCCDECGICVDACPMGSIKADAPGIVDGICIKCCGCVKKCPKDALFFEDERFIYHKTELEQQYSERKEPVLFI